MAKSKRKVMYYRVRAKRGGGFLGEKPEMFFALFGRRFFGLGFSGTRQCRQSERRKNCRTLIFVQALCFYSQLFISLFHKKSQERLCGVGFGRVTVLDCAT